MTEGKTSSPGISSKEKTIRVHSTLSDAVYKLLKGKFPACSDGQAVAQAVESFLRVEIGAKHRAGYNNFKCTHNDKGYVVRGLNRTQAAKVISPPLESMPRGLSKKEQAKFKKGIGRDSLRRGMETAKVAGYPFTFNGWIVTDDRESGQ